MAKRARTSAIDADARSGECAAQLYPEIEPYSTGFLKVGGQPTTKREHEIYYEECGNPNGKPVVILHGGPGAGCSAKQRRLHDPQKYRIVLFDQRGCGRSTPEGCLEDNTTWHLCADIESLRTKLAIGRWQVFGGSWGSTLALTYAIMHPDRCTELILRGVFLVKKAELDFLYQTGTPNLFPEAYAKVRDPIPFAEQGDLVSAYRKRVMSADRATALAHARLWCEWEDSTSSLVPAPLEEWSGSGGEQRIHLHYMWHRGFFEYDGWILDQLHTIRHLPTVIVQGRYDVVCPSVSACELAKRLDPAKTQLHVVPDSGHSAWEPGTTACLVAATREFCEP